MSAISVSVVNRKNFLPLDTRHSLFRGQPPARAVQAPEVNVRTGRERRISSRSRDDYGRPTACFRKSEQTNGRIRARDENLSVVERLVVADPAVAETGLGEDEAGPGGVVVELPAQVDHEHTDASTVARPARTPHLLEQLFAGHQLAAVREQDL